MYRKKGHGSVNVEWPRAFAVCDRCGFVYNHKDLNWQSQWIGPQVQNLKILVCDSCLDKKQEQLRTIVLPPDPIPVDTPRPEHYDIIVPSPSVTEPIYLTTEGGDFLVTQSVDYLVE
jgi:hypothetical protein